MEGKALLVQNTKKPVAHLVDHAPVEIRANINMVPRVGGKSTRRVDTRGLAKAAVAVGQDAKRSSFCEAVERAFCEQTEWTEKVLKGDVTVNTEISQMMYKLEAEHWPEIKKRDRHDGVVRAAVKEQVEARRQMLRGVSKIYEETPGEGK